MPRDESGEGRAGGGWFCLKLAVLTGIAMLVMIASWPWVRLNPAVNIVKAFRPAASFHATYPVLFGGSVFSSAELPRTYLPWYLLITTPPAILLLEEARKLIGRRMRRGGAPAPEGPDQGTGRRLVPRAGLLLTSPPR